MLLEKVSYPDDFPISIRIVQITEYPLHYHQDIEILYVLKGHVTLKNGYCHYPLKQGDVFTNNGREVHSLFSDKCENIIAVIKISNLFFTQYFPELNKSCYRTYSRQESDVKLDTLRKTILQILLIYLQKSFNYKQHCIEAVLELIKLLNSSFNLFAFVDQIVVNFENDNPVTIERMSRIINYLYENHATKITLEDLANLEHLSTFHLSHLIHDCVGMSFRDFLCFIRAEWSEIYLLDTDKSVSTIAKDVGFSTTSYYEKYFHKWFGRSPEEHRSLYKPLVKSPGRPETVSPLSLSKSINIVKSTLSAANSQDNSKYHVHNMKLDINIDAAAEAIMPLNHQLEFSVTLEDFRTMGYSLFGHLRAFGCKRAVIRAIDEREEASGELAALQAKLEKRGISVAVSATAALTSRQAYGLDSIIAPVYIFNSCLLCKDEYLHVSLRDQGDTSTILKGLPSLLTSSMIPKPSYYAYLALTKMAGDLICWGKNYAVIRLCGAPAYAILAYNYNSEQDKLCAINSTLYEVNNIINRFNDEFEINFSLNVSPGRYFVSRYSLNKQGNIFNFMSKLNFPKQLKLGHDSHIELFVQPEMDAYTEEVESSLNVDFSFKGIGLQLALIQSIGEESNYE